MDARRSDKRLEERVRGGGGRLGWRVRRRRRRTHSATVAFSWYYCRGVGRADQSHGTIASRQDTLSRVSHNAGNLARETGKKKNAVETGERDKRRNGGSSEGSC